MPKHRFGFHVLDKLGFNNCSTFMRERILNVRNALKSVICTAIIVYTVILPLSWFRVRKITFYFKKIRLATNLLCWSIWPNCILYPFNGFCGVHFNFPSASININSFTPFCWTYLSLAIIMVAGQRRHFLLVCSCVRLQGLLTLLVNMFLFIFILCRVLSTTLSVALV